ncbi:MAG: molybdopterin molybdotransferase MoeA [Micrococcales bacterium]|nr:molybdopterin molybdotransferase MoeA [Micrococcales bacterium]
MNPTSISEHRAALRGLLGDGVRQTVPLDRHAAGRHLAEDLLACDDLPRFDNSAMDGYAVHPSGAEQREFVVVADVPAGAPPDVTLRPGEAARIMTGARLPDGATAVVAVEQTDASPTGPAPGRVALTCEAETGRHIRLRGEEVLAGSVIAPAGAPVTPGLIALARSAGCFVVTTWAPTRVAVVATGTELTDASHCAGDAGIHESNSDMIASLCAAAGCRVTSVDTCRDDPAALTVLFDELDRRVDVDVIVTTGGISEGAFEVVRQLGESLGTFAFTHLTMQPGAPQGLGTYGTTPVVCFPGTPVGAYVSFRMLLRPVLDACHGSSRQEARSAAYTGVTRRVRPGKVQFVTAVLARDGTVTAAAGRHLSALAGADALIEVPIGAGHLVTGDTVTVHLL